MDDIQAILAAAGSADIAAADLNGDGAVGLDDAAAALSLVGSAPGPSALVCNGGESCQ